MKPEDYCREKAAAAGTNLYYACLFYPPHQQHVLHALFALQSELADIILECKDVAVATIKLQWWQQEIEALYQGQARHPVTRRLMELDLQQNIEAAEIQALLNGIAMQLHQQACESLQQLLDEKENGLAHLWSAAARLVGCEDEPHLKNLASLAAHYYSLEQVFLAELLIQKGVCPFPEQEMQELGKSENDLVHPQNKQSLVSIQKKLVAKLETGLQQQVKIAMDTYPQPLLFALVLAQVELASCKKMFKQDTSLASEVANITPLRKLWIAWRMRRKLG